MWVILARSAKPPARGRPGATSLQRWKTLRLVARERRRQGARATCRSVRKALKETKYRALVRDFACALKRRQKLREKQRREAARVHITVLWSNAVWAGDGTHLGRDETNGRAVAENVIDVGTRELVDTSVGQSVTGKDVVAALERGSRERGGDPLVFMSDRGAENTCEETQSQLRERKIVHVMNVPRTPEHNAHCERNHGTLKAALEIEPASAGLVLDASEWKERVDEARDFLNHRLPRAHLAGQTPAEYAATLSPWYDAVDRDAFYAATCAAVEAALVGVEDAHERFLKEREAKLATMEQFNLIRRTRGDAIPLHRKPEGIT